MFAKLFGPDDDQVLVTLDSDDKTKKPTIRISFVPKDIPQAGICSSGLSFSDSPEGWERAEQILEEITEESARSVVAAAMKDVAPRLELSEEETVEGDEE
jgi:hypothetical protein